MNKATILSFTKILGAHIDSHHDKMDKISGRVSIVYADKKIDLNELL